MEFMAIEVLLGIDHTYRYNLESFFYVLIWLYARRRWDLYRNLKGRPKESVLTKWYSSSFKDITEAKRGYIYINRFEDILDKFLIAFNSIKPLYRKIRGILFPLLDDGALFKGTRPDPPKKLYNPIIKAFNNVIASLA